MIGQFTTISRLSNNRPVECNCAFLNKSMEMRENGSNQEAQKEYGTNIHVVLEFARHATPGKTPDGMSADFLTEPGKKMAEDIGQERAQEKNIGGYSSPAMRAQQTTDIYLDNTNELVQVLNKQLVDQNAKYPGQREENVFKIKVRQELAPVSNFAKIMPLAKEYAKNQKDAGSELDDLTLIIQYYLDNPEKSAENNVESPREAAAAIAHQAVIEFKMTDRFYANTDLRLVNVTHAPRLEAFLREVIQFNKLEEIGGAVKEGENIQFFVDIDDNRNKKITMVFREKEYKLTPEQIDTISTLSSEYQNRLEEARNNA